MIFGMCLIDQLHLTFYNVIMWQRSNVIIPEVLYCQCFCSTMYTNDCVNFNYADVSRVKNMSFIYRGFLVQWIWVFQNSENNHKVISEIFGEWSIYTSLICLWYIYGKLSFVLVEEVHLSCMPFIVKRRFLTWEVKSWWHVHGSCGLWWYVLYCIRLVEILKLVSDIWSDRIKGSVGPDKV
jgi:hypothetical protein